MGKWINTSERMPHIDERVIVCLKGDDIELAAWLGNDESDVRWYTEASEYEFEEVTHWQPLPEPPEVE